MLLPFPRLSVQPVMASVNVTVNALTNEFFFFRLTGTEVVKLAKLGHVGLTNYKCQWLSQHDKNDVIIKPHE